MRLEHLLSGDQLLNALAGKTFNLYHKLTAGRQEDKQEGQIRVRKVVAEEYIGWTRGEFRFTRTRLEEVMTRLARWYDVEVFFAVPDLKNARFTLNLERYDNINKILSKIEKTGRVHFRIQGQCIIVE